MIVVGNLKGEPRSFPIRKDGSLKAERVEATDAVGGRKRVEIRDMRWHWTASMSLDDGITYAETLQVFSSVQ